MKTTIIFLIASLLVLLIGCGGGSKSIKGTWEMVYPESKDGPTTPRSIKIVSDTHFAFGSTTDKGRIFAGGGTYTFSDSTYTEFIQYHTMRFLVGQQLEFRCVIDNDKWYHSGSFDIDSRRFKINEIWQRVDQD